MDKWIEIDLGAVRHNIGRVKESLSAGVLLMAVVKADAYGHGAVEISRLALREGAACLGVLGIEEAARLRAAGVKSPIVMLGPTLSGNAGEVVRNRVIPTVDSLDFLSALDKAVSGIRPPFIPRPSSLVPNPFPRKYPYYLDIDFGLRRWGIEPEDTEKFLRGAKKFSKLALAGVSTHLDYVPGKNAVEVEEKLPLFSRCAETVKRAYPEALRHASNSSIFRDFPHWQLDMVRIGNLMYGINPAATHGAQAVPPLTGYENPWKLLARIASIRTVKSGQSIGYASEYIASGKMKVASVPIGYSDGMTMSPAERFIRIRGAFRFWGMINGRKAPFIGRCGISHTLLDVTDVPGVKVGDIVHLPIRRTSASPRIMRIYKEG